MGKIFGDRGYVSEKLASQLLEQFGIQFFAKPRRNMKNRLMRLHDKLLSRKRCCWRNISSHLKTQQMLPVSRVLRKVG
ncbi:transposase [Nostoc punctiforme]|uniref:transposase n=1 Tax=Nostoc punctiforme TaxID=272131 RepID=UPI0028C3F686|nr:transposase [Nostoc punctiforme]